jgi:hypothetical protein
MLILLFIVVAVFSWAVWLHRVEERAHERGHREIAAKALEWEEQERTERPLREAARKDARDTE